MYRHVLWDWNGTLLDDAWLSLEVINRMLGKRGLPEVDAEVYGQVFGFPLERYCRRIGFDLERESFTALSDQFSLLYEARRLECGLRAGARSVLAAVTRLGVGQSVLSAYEQDALVSLVGHFGLSGFFAEVVGVDNQHGSGKVELGERWFRGSGWVAGEVILVGDTLHDLEVAAAMGVDCALIPSGHQHRHRLDGQGVAVLGELEDLLTLLA
ncbi:MAG: HAD family hydrolase [Candidatus Latescibacterota bacterium]|jgi:phosphoglycolate phosphatase